MNGLRLYITALLIIVSFLFAVAGTVAGTVAGAATTEFFLPKERWNYQRTFPDPFHDIILPS